MNNKKLVSICIPTYKRPDYLRIAIESCLSQSYKNIEIIVCDNSEDDDSLAMIDTHYKGRVKYFKNLKNIGSQANIEKCRTLSSGSYIKYLMDDDILYPCCIEKMVSEFDNNKNIGVVISPLDVIDLKGEKRNILLYSSRKISRLYEYRKEDCLIDGRKVLDDFLTKLYPFCIPSGVMYRSDAISRGFDLNAKFAIDVEIGMWISLKYDTYYINESLSGWRYSEDSDTVNMHVKGIDGEVLFYVANKYLNILKNERYLKNYKFNQLRRKAHLFASKRCSLNILNGLKKMNIKIIIDTVAIINKNDKSIINKLILPYECVKEFIIGLFKSYLYNK